jgi:probable HAF family extracellular repeat protein
MKRNINLVWLFVVTTAMVHAQFTFTDIGGLPGGGAGSTATAYALNAAGEVCGSGNSQAHVWRPVAANATLGGMVEIGAGGVCTAISKFAAVGYVRNVDGTQRAAAFTGGAAPIILPVPETATRGTNSIAHAINDAGLIAGEWSPASGISHAMLWHKRGTTYTPEDLNSPGFKDWMLAAATGVNRKGQVVGWGSLRGSTHAFLLTPGAGITDLGSLTPMPYDHSIATGVNDLGQVVGYSVVMTPAGVRYHAFLWVSGSMVDLGVPQAQEGASPFQNSVATAINNHGTIAGFANTTEETSESYADSGHGWGVAAAYDMNAGDAAPGLVTGWNILSGSWVTMGDPAAPSGMVSAMVAAFGVNESDQIAGVFVRAGGVTGGFLLTSRGKR